MYVSASAVFEHCPQPVRVDDVDRVSDASSGARPARHRSRRTPPPAARPRTVTEPGRVLRGQRSRGRVEQVGAGLARSDHGEVPPRRRVQRERRRRSARRRSRARGKRPAGATAGSSSAGGSARTPRRRAAAAHRPAGPATAGAAAWRASSARRADRGSRPAAHGRGTRRSDRRGRRRCSRSRCRAAARPPTLLRAIEHVAAAGQRDPDRELAEDRVALRVQRLDATQRLAREDQMDAVRATLARHRFEQRNGRAVPPGRRRRAAPGTRRSRRRSAEAGPSPADRRTGSRPASL